MNVVFKSVLFLSIAVVGIYCCNQIFVSEAPDKTETQWEFVAGDRQKAAQPTTALASHASEDGGWLTLDAGAAEAELAVYEASDEAAATPKIRELPAITSEAQPIEKLIRSPYVRDLPPEITSLPPETPRVISLPVVDDEVALEQIAEPTTAASLFAESANAVINPFAKQDNTAEYSTTDLPAIEEEQAEPSIADVPAKSENEFVANVTGSSQRVQNQYFNPDQTTETPESNPPVSMLESIENQFVNETSSTTEAEDAYATTDESSFEPMQTVSTDLAAPSELDSQQEPADHRGDFQPLEMSGTAAIETPQEVVQPTVPEQFVAPHEEMQPTVPEQFVAPQEVVQPTVPEQFVAPHEEMQPTVTEEFVAQPGVQKQSVSDRFERETSKTLSTLSASLSVEERALEHIAYGKSLARRGSVFAARQEFMQALRIITESYDMQTGSRAYTEKLALGWRALSESDDFVAIDTEQQMNMDLAGILDTHTTQIIDPRLASELSPIQAMQTYYAFAGEQMMQAVGNSVVASEALHSLGKLLTTAARFDASGKPQDRTKAMVMHQVALSANTANHLSANELGVLLANNGRWQQALKLFSQSLRTEQTAAAWKNLAAAHEQLAIRTDDRQEQQQQSELARLALQEFNLVSAGDRSLNTALPTEWASPEQFGELAAMPEIEGQPPATESAAETTAQKPTSKGLLKNMKDWF